MGRMPTRVEAAASAPAEEFLTLWDFIPDPGPMIRDPMWREHRMHELTRPADWTPTPVMVMAPLPPSDRLTALIDGAGVGRRPPRDVSTVEAAIARSIPADVPSFADEILSARKVGGDLVARVRLFDGGTIVLTVVGGAEPSVREWEAEGDQRAFAYVDGTWTRFDATVEPRRDRRRRLISEERIEALRAVMNGEIV